MSYKLINTNEEFAHCCKIYVGKHQGNKLVYYYKCDMSFDFFMKWKWYFEYRAALLKVEFPRLNVWCDFVSYKKVIPSEAYHKKLKNLVSSRKGKITEFRKKIEDAKAKWEMVEQNLLFKTSLEDDPLYKKVEARLQSHIMNLKEAQDELDNFKEYPSSTTFEIVSIDQRKNKDFLNKFKITKQ